MENFVLMMKRLSSCEWFTSRTSVAGLYAAIYKKCGPIQTELQKYVDIEGSGVDGDDNIYEPKEMGIKWT